MKIMNTTDYQQTRKIAHDLLFKGNSFYMLMKNQCAKNLGKDLSKSIWNSEKLKFNK